MQKEIFQVKAFWRSTVSPSP